MATHNKEIKKLAWSICDTPKAKEITSCNGCPCSNGCLAQYYAKRAYAALGLMSKSYYIITLNYAVTDAYGNTVEDTEILTIKRTKKSAVEFFKTAIKEDYAHAVNNDWSIHEDSDTCFDAGEPDHYNFNHTCYKITEFIDREGE